MLETEGTLRKGWARVAFGDIARQVQDRVDPDDSGLERYVAGEHMDTDDLRIRRWGTIGAGYLGPAFHMRFKPGHVLYGSRRTYLRKVAVADFEGITANTTFVIESKDPNVLLPELLPFIMQTESFHDHSKKQSKGSVNPYVNFSDLTWYEFALPPLEEQLRIATALAAIRHSDSTYEEMAIAASGLHRSQSQESFSALLSDPAVPVRPLGELIDGGVSNGIFRKREQFGAGLPLINVTDCYVGFRVPLSRLDRVNVAEKEYNSFSAQPGDVIFNRSSLVASGIGHACLVPASQEKMVFECHLMRVRPRPGLLSGAFLARYALSPIGRGYILARAKTTTMTTISQGDLEEMPIPCPDLGTQRWLEGQLSAVDTVMDEIRTRRSHLRVFGSGLLSAIWPA
jgi:type I restriction enzyme S subunit